MESSLNINVTLQGGKYEIIKVLGQGGFGITYLVRHTLLNKTYALKEFFPKDYCNRDSDTSQLTVATTSNIDLVDRLRGRFITEARNITKLKHPGIIQIHDVFEENSTAYYVMDFIEGESLEDIVKRYGALHEQTAVTYITAIADALEYIHRNRMSHYDVKPANIMVSKHDGQPVLIDFGLSKQFDSQGHATSTLLMGVSHGYSPLEQYVQDGITAFSPQSDVYALGATLYTLVTGLIPPEAPKLLGREIEMPTTVSQPIQNAVKWAMRSDPNVRCPSAAAFIGALQGNAQQQTATTIDIPSQNVGFSQQATQINPAFSQQPPVMPVNPRPKKSGMQGWVIGLIIGLVVLVGILVAVMLTGNDGNSTKEDPYVTSEAQTGAPENAAAQHAAEVMEADAEEPTVETSGMPGIFKSIVENGIPGTRGGKTAYYYSGMFSVNGQNYPVMFCFVVNENDNTLNVVYKNVKYKAKMDMNVLSVDNNSMQLNNAKNGFSVLLEGSGSEMTGTASQGDSTLDVYLSPTSDTF